MEFCKKQKLNKWNIIEAISIDIIIASIIVIIFTFFIDTLFNDQLKNLINYIDILSIKGNSNIATKITFDDKNKKLENYPEYGERYADIIIDSLEINLPLYYGDKLSFLRYGIGQSSGAYFPGEGGTIICMGHNTTNFLKKLPEISINDKIKITTSYGEFTYKVNKTKIVNMYDLDELPIQNGEEILMLYTCYPVNGLGHKTDRFVVYANRVS